MSELQQADTPPASPTPADQPPTTVDTPRSTQTDTHRSAEPEDPYAPAFDPPDSADRAPAADAAADHDPYAPVFDPLGDPADQAPDSSDTAAAGPDDADGYDPMAHLDLGAWDPTDWINGSSASGATATDATQARPAPEPAQRVACQHRGRRRQPRRRNRYRRRAPRRPPGCRTGGGHARRPTC